VPAVRPRPFRTRAVALSIVLAAGAGVGLTACGSSGSSAKPSISAIEGKLAADTDFKTLNTATLTCIAGVLRQYASAASLDTYVKTGDASDVNGSDANETKAENGTKACVTKYETAG
jgi:hypothetical protein